jgi:signal transduction histidine kinase
VASSVLALVIGAAFAILVVSATAERDSIRLARHAEQELAAAQRLGGRVQALEARPHAVRAAREARSAAVTLQRLTEPGQQRERADEIAAALDDYVRAAAAGAPLHGLAAALGHRLDTFIAGEERFAQQRELRSVRQSRMARATAITGLAVSVVLIVAFGLYVVRAMASPIRRADAMEASLETNRQGLRQLAEEQSALRRVATLVARGVPAPELLGAVVREVDRVLGASSTRLAQFLPGDVVEIIVSSQVGGGLPVGARWPADGRHLAGEIRRTGRPARREGTKGAGDDLAARLREDGVRSAVATPIVVDGRLWGTMTAYWTDRVAAPDMEVRMEQFTELVATAIANTESRAALTASRARVVATADETRRRIERDLHDGAQQRLVHTVVTLKLARRALAAGETGSFERRVEEALDHAERANAALRELVHGILPAALSRSGLRGAVDSLVARAPIEVRVDVTDERFAPGLEATAYFIVAEALTNVFKHANADHARIRAAVEDGVLEVEVADDGDGGARLDGSSGLLGLSDRTAAAGGDLTIESPPGEGTTVTARLPLVRVSAPHARG